MIRPMKRRGYWYLVRRVPTAIAHLDKRQSVHISTKIKIIDDPRGVAATPIANRINKALEADWRALADGVPLAELEAFKVAKGTARALGFDYAPVATLNDRTVDELLSRIEVLEKRNFLEAPVTVEAVLGGIDTPPLRVSEFVSAFEAHEKSSLATMSPNQLKRWRSPKLRAAALFVKVIGDLPMDQITRSHALDFREHWQDRIENENLKIGTANKDFGHMNKMFKTINDALRLGLVSPFSELTISGDEPGQRTAYDPAFVQSHILQDGMLDELNDEARRILYLIADTGLRLAEACNLQPMDIHLNAPVPYISVIGHQRHLKTQQSKRDIPLVGAALAAMQASPKGFPRYHDKESSLSALINDALTVRNLRPLPKQSLYSLRHTFEDRLTAVEAPEKLIAMLMGHRYARPKYGVGPSLAQKRDWLLKIAFRSPSKV